MMPPSMKSMFGFDSKRLAVLRAERGEVALRST